MRDDCFDLDPIPSFAIIALRDYCLARRVRHQKSFSLLNCAIETRSLFWTVFSVLRFFRRADVKHKFGEISREKE